MKTKQVLVWVLIIVGSFSILWLAGKNKSFDLQNETKETSNIPQNISGGENKLTATEVFYDFGVISMKNGDVSKVFQVSNSSDQDITLENISTSCMCTTAYILGPNGNKKGPFGMLGHGGMVPKANELIKAGETREIEIIYDPNAHGPVGVGMIERLVYLEDSNGNKLQFEIKANVTP